MAGQAKRHPSAELVGPVVQAVEEAGRKDLVDEVQHQNNWVGGGSCHNEEDRPAEDKVVEVALACGARHIVEQGFVVVAACYGACRCLDDRTGRQLVEGRKAQLACRQGRRLRGLHCELHRLKQQGHRSVPSVVPQALPQRSTWQCAQRLPHRG